MSGSLSFTVCLALALAFVGCSSDSTSTLAAVPTTGTPVTETFSGTVQVGGADLHTFAITVSGSVSATLTAAGPPPTIFMGLSIGTPLTSGSVTTCTPLTGASVGTQAGTAAQLSGTAQAGAYCVAVSDIGNQTAPVMYTVAVTHT